MSLSVIPVSENFPDMGKLCKLNNEAFPQIERISTERLIRMAEKNQIDLNAVYDQKRFVGFFAMFSGPGCAYIFFFAVEPSLRSKGYGSQMLNVVRTTYPDSQIVLDLEEADLEAENYEQRLSRKRFYSRGGYRESGYHVNYVGVTYEVLFLGDSFDLDSFKKLLSKISGIVNDSGKEMFHPVLSKM